jgi:hypothetical protein
VTLYGHRQYWSHMSISSDAIILPDLPRLFKETEHDELQRHRDVLHKALEEMETIQPGLEPRSRGIAAEQLVAHLREQERRAKYWTWCSLGAITTLLTVMAGATSLLSPPIDRPLWVQSDGVQPVGPVEIIDRSTKLVTASVKRQVTTQEGEQAMPSHNHRRREASRTARWSRCSRSRDT